MSVALAAVVVAPFGIALAVACLRQPMRVALPVFAALIPFGERLSLGGSPFTSLSSWWVGCSGSGSSCSSCSAIAPRRGCPFRSRSGCCSWRHGRRDHAVDLDWC